jgi:dTDP-4-dehydrorhamnose 3,5-epimerase
MRFEPTPLAGATLIHPDPRTDERGSFARAFCAREFAAAGLETTYVQTSIGDNARAGTVRGMHFQRAPHAEVKLVRCIKGAIYDVIVDMRETSPTYLRWFGTDLTEDNGLTLYVPQGFAHGYQALSDGATVLYMASAFYAPEAEGGLRHDDPRLAIAWPLPVAALSPRDAQHPLLAEGLAGRAP